MEEKMKRCPDLSEEHILMICCVELVQTSNNIEQKNINFIMIYLLNGKIYGSMEAGMVCA